MKPSARSIRTTAPGLPDTVSSALSSLDTRLTALESAPRVASFNGRSGAVVPVPADYPAATVPFSGAGFTATTVQDAMLELMVGKMGNVMTHTAITSVA